MNRVDGRTKTLVTLRLGHEKVCLKDEEADISDANEGENQKVFGPEFTYVTEYLVVRDEVLCV